MSSPPDPLELLREMNQLGKEVDAREASAGINDALKELGQPRLGGPPRTRHIPDLEKALQQPGDAHSRQELERALDNLRRQKQIREELDRLKAIREAKILHKF